MFHSFTIIGFCWALASLASAQPPVFSGARKALIIGNSTYRHLAPLETPGKNAGAIASTLTAMGFHVEVRFDLDQSQMLHETRTFLNTIGREDLFFFYYSGYGVQIASANWLLPVNFDPTANTMISQQAYSMRRLLSDIDVRNVEARIVVIDASRECAALAKTASGDGLANMDPESHTLLSFSAQPGQVFKDLPGASLGLFTASLIEALKTPELNLVGIFNKLQNLVAKSGGAPTPYFISSLIGNFALIAPPLAPPPKPIIPPVSEELTPGTSRENLRDRLMYVWIPPGTFKMGCAPPDRNCAADEKPQHQVKISKGFWMTRTEVTVGAYERFTDATGHRPPSRTKTNPKWILTDHPVTMVSWQDARDYCQWAGGRLPTEAEWEYAARGGRSDEIYPWGNRFDAELVNSFEHSKKKGKFLETVPVRRYETNGFNLYDMAGNVREWTNDVYDPTEYNRGGAVVDPHEDGEGKRRIIRGGSFNGGSKDLRLSLRDHREVLREVTNQTGFRCILARL